MKMLQHIVAFHLPQLVAYHEIYMFDDNRIIRRITGAEHAARTVVIRVGKTTFTVIDKNVIPVLVGADKPCES